MKNSRAIIVSLFAVLFIAGSVSDILDNVSDQYTDDAMTRALVSFGVARGLNGIISVAQGTEIAVHPAGFGVNFTPGQVLDPVNDLIEQFSWFMLASAASIGVQKVFLNISASIVATVLLVVLLLLSVLICWRPTLMTEKLRRFILFSAIIMLFLRFSVPVVAISSELMFKVFLSDQYNESTENLEQTQRAFGELNEQRTELIVDESILAATKRYLDTAKQSINMEAKIAKYTEVAAKLSRDAVNLIVVFITQTVLFPLLFLWLIYQGLKYLIRNASIQI